MGMEVVDGIIISLLAAGLICVTVSAGGDVRLDDECRAAWRRLTRATGVLLLASGFLCVVDSSANIDVEEIDEPITVESRRIIEDGFDIQTVSSHANGVMVMTNNNIIPTGGFNGTDVRYIVMCEGDDGIETLDFGTSGRVTVREDAESWEDARLETVETAVERYTGTFFGMPVKDTKVEGRLWPDYVIHVPEGGIETAGL